MNRKSEKPTPEAKALSLFLMAYKSKDPIYKEKSKQINKLWDLVCERKMGREEYQVEVKKMLTEYGGYNQVIEKTVHHYVEKTGKWTLKGEDKYSEDAQKVADAMIAK